MKNQIAMCIMLSLAAAMIMPAIAQAAGSSSTIDALSIYSLQVNPNPIFAGQNITINLQLYDSYPSSLNNVNLELEGSYPILNVSPSNPYLIGSIGQGLYGGLNSYFTYNIHIPKNTPSGNYTLNLVANYQTIQMASGIAVTVTGSSVMPLTFYVHGTPQLSISPTVTSIVPGSSSTVSLSIINSGYGSARNITVETLNTSAFSATGTRKFSIGSLSAGASSSLTATYLANSHITNGTYSLPLHITYESDQGTSYNQTLNQTIGVRLQNPNIIVSIVSANPATLYSGYNQSLTLSVQNIGYGNANNVSVNMSAVQGVSVLSSIRHFFIGSIPAGQSATETLLVSASNYSGTEASLNAAISYYTSNYQKQFSKNQALNISIAPSAIFQINSGKYAIYAGDTTVPVNFTITNTGNVDAQQVQLSFQSSYPLTPVSGSGYIQDLKPGQTAKVSFLVSVDSHGVPGTYPITVYETWRQPNGASQQTYSGSSNYYAAVSGSSGGSVSGIIGDIVVIVIVVAIGAFVYRRMKKDREAKKKKTPKAL